MARVELRGLSKSFGETPVLHDVNLEIESGSFTVFVGPSGCGKSTLLRIIAGLEDPTGGDILFDGASVNERSPAQRQIAMVFQSYALYPHMSVYDNMAFSLKLRNETKETIDAAVKAAAQMLDIEHLLTRRPRELSGGQRQRVAIGRAIVRKPKVFLFDEPLSNLDAELRSRTRYELARLHQTLATTMIYVTHDQVEAMTLADKIVVLSKGHIEQIGAPLALYHHPANLFVAGFIGSPQMNFLTGELAETSAARAAVRLPSGDILTAHVDASSARIGEPVTFGARPHHIDLAATPESNTLSATIDFVERLGGISHAHVVAPGAREALTIALPDASAEKGQTVRLRFAPAHCHVFNAEGAAFPRVQS